MDRRQFVFGVIGQAAIGALSAVRAENPLRLQLNWFHDPSFAAAYILNEGSPALVQVVEGGPNTSALAAVLNGYADVAVVGIDIAIKHLAERASRAESVQLRILSVDFQRNPVGWVVHPDVGKRLGLDLARWQAMAGKERNTWLLEAAKAGRIKIGDKSGTETTAVWQAWKAVHGATSVKPFPVGFDPKLVLSAPKLAYPVYLNEEPFKLAAAIGTQVLVFDPADDGVIAYGNILITSKAKLDANNQRLINFRQAYNGAWRTAVDDRALAARVVRKFYKAASDLVLTQQVEKTLDFVTYGGAEPGMIDLSPNGRLEATLNTLKLGGGISSALTFQSLASTVVK